MLLTLYLISRRALMFLAVIVLAALLPKPMDHELLMRTELSACLGFLGEGAEEAARSALKIICARGHLADTFVFMNCFDGFELVASRLLIPFLALKYQILGLMALSFMAWRGLSQRRVLAMRALSAHKYWLFKLLRLSTVALAVLSVQSACSAAVAVTCLELALAYLSGACAGVMFGYEPLQG